MAKNPKNKQAQITLNPPFPTNEYGTFVLCDAVKTPKTASPFV